MHSGRAAPPPADPARRRPADVAYILGTFPQASQTFIAREIRGVIASGRSVLVFARRRNPRTRPDAADLAWAERIRFVPHAGSPAVLSAHLHLFRRDPRRYLRTLGALVALPHRPRVLALRALGLFWSAAWIARQVECEAGRPRIHAHFALAQTEVAMAVGALLDRPFSFTAHARDIYGAPSALAEKIRAARTVVTCTTYNARYLRGLCPDLPANHVKLVYHGVEVLSPALAASGRSLDPPRLLAAGRLVDKKGFDVLIAACAILRDRGRAFACRIAGEGPGRPALLAQIAAARLTTHVTLAGWVGPNEMTAMLRDAAIVVVPSRIASRGDRDGIPNVVLEAMAQGRPVVATRVSGIPEAVEDGRTGRLVEPDEAAALAEALLGLLDDPAAREAMGRAAHATAIARFDLARSTADLARALELEA